MPEKIVQLNEAVIKDRIKELVRGMVSNAESVLKRGVLRCIMA